MKKLEEVLSAAHHSLRRFCSARRSKSETTARAYRKKQLVAGEERERGEIPNKSEEMDGGSGAPNARRKYTDDVVGASAAQTDRRRRNAEGAEGYATETDRTAALTHRNAAPSHRNGAQTHRNTVPSHRNRAQTHRKTAPKHRNAAQTQTTAFNQTGTIYKPQRRRKEKEETRALDEEAIALERKRDQNFESPGFTPAANNRGPGCPAGGADVAGRNPPKPPRLSLRTPATRPTRAY